MMRKLIAIALAVIPLAVIFECNSMLEGTALVVEWQSPKYPQMEKDGLSSLSKEQLVTLASSAMDRGKTLAEYSRAKMGTDYSVFLLQSALLLAYAAGLCFYVYRSKAKQDNGA